MTVLRALFGFFCLLVPAAVGAAEPLVADLSKHLVAITTGFAGTDVLLFGAVEGDGDVVVVVRGPNHTETVRRKQRQFGIWVNSGRARATNGRVALLRVIEPAEFQHFATIGNLVKEEARQDAEDLLQRLAGEINGVSGQVPVLYVREGNPRDELISLINEDPAISILVLAADPGPRGPGPLVTALTGRYVGKLRVG